MAKKNVRYEVIKDFKDLQDQNKIYTAGDAYPKPANKKVGEKRLKELMTSANKQGQPVIKEIEMPEVDKDSK